MATEQLIVRAVKAGGDRQVAHETIRKHSLEAARAMTATLHVIERLLPYWENEIQTDLGDGLAIDHRQHQWPVFLWCVL